MQVRFTEEAIKSHDSIARAIKILGSNGPFEAHQEACNCKNTGKHTARCNSFVYKVKVTKYDSLRLTKDWIEPILTPVISAV
jgi:hypothetical protein